MAQPRDAINDTGQAQREVVTSLSHQLTLDAYGIPLPYFVTI